MVTVLRATIPLGLAVLLAFAGCIGSEGTSTEDVAPSEANTTNATLEEPEVTLNRTVETVNLSWTEVKARHSVIEGTNCFSLHTDGAVVEAGNVTAVWRAPGLVGTSSYTILRIQKSDLDRRVEHRLGPTHYGEPYTVDIDGWNLTTELPMDLQIGLVAPEQVYAGAQLEASVTVDIRHTGTVTDVVKGVCS